MREYSPVTQDILDYIEAKNISESERNEVMDALIEQDTDFQDLFDRFVDEISTRIDEMSNLRPNSKIMRNNKIISYMYWEFLEKRVERLEQDIHIRTASEEALEEHGAGKGVIRKQLVKATGSIYAGSSVPPDRLYQIPTLFTVGTPGSIDAEPLRFVVTETPSIDVGHIADPVDGKYWIEVAIQAENGGANYNLEAGKIGEIFTQTEYFSEVKQVLATAGGYDLEDIEVYRARVLQKEQANVEYSPTWFQSEAESFAGVQEAIVIPVIYGEGTVGIILRGTGSTIPQSLIDEVQARFDSETVKPLGNWRAFVEAISTQSFDIDLSVLSEPGATVVQSEVYAAVEGYFSQLSVGEDYSETQLIAVIQLVTNVFAVVINSPVEAIRSVPANALAVSGTITATFQEYIP